jgi:hypothetical protein
MLSMTAARAVTLEIKTVQAWWGLVWCHLREGRCRLGSAATPVLAGMHAILCIVNHSPDLHDFALLDRESPYGKQFGICSTVGSIQPFLITIEQGVRCSIISIKCTLILQSDLESSCWLSWFRGAVAFSIRWSLEKSENCSMVAHVERGMLYIPLAQLPRPDSGPGLASSYSGDSQAAMPMKARR